MLRVTRLTDYAIVLLTNMAERAQGELRQAREVADATGIPLPTLTKLLKGLVKSGLVASHRGTKGGYRLARPADEINLADVIAAIEGPVSMTDCSGVPGSCEREGSCPVQSNWQRINVVVREALSRITLADMRRPLARETLVSLGAIGNPSATLREPGHPRAGGFADASRVPGPEVGNPTATLREPGARASARGRFADPLRVRDRRSRRRRSCSRRPRRT